jgi:flagellar protein FlbD
MITLHRLGHADHELHVNPDLILTIDANPDTVISLANGSKLVVAETPAQVAEEVRRYRVDVLSGALRRRRDGEPAQAPTGLRLANPEAASAVATLTTELGR